MSEQKNFLATPSVGPIAPDFKIIELHQAAGRIPRVPAAPLSRPDPYSPGKTQATKLLIEELEETGHEVLYGDSDSVFVRPKGSYRSARDYDLYDPVDEMLFTARYGPPPSKIGTLGSNSTPEGDSVGLKGLPSIPLKVASPTKKPDGSQVARILNPDGTPLIMRTDLVAPPVKETKPWSLSFSVTPDEETREALKKLDQGRQKITKEQLRKFTHDFHKRVKEGLESRSESVVDPSMIHNPDGTVSVTFDLKQREHIEFLQAYLNQHLESRGTEQAPLSSPGKTIAAVMAAEKYKELYGKEQRSVPLEVLMENESYKYGSLIHETFERIDETMYRPSITDLFPQGEKPMIMNFAHLYPGDMMAAQSAQRGVCPSLNDLPDLSEAQAVPCDISLVEENSDLWSILQSITSKKNWYEKVYREDILKDWLVEAENEAVDTDVFWLAIRILRASCQGVKIEHDCDWEEDGVCGDCREKLTKEAWIEYCQDENHDTQDSEDFEDFVEDYICEVDCYHPRCTCTAPDSTLEKYLLYTPDGLISAELREQLKTNLSKMCHDLPVIWHPGSNEQVRDIIHPSWYPYVTGVSARKDGQVDFEVEEKFRYAWLPSEFDVDEEGKMTLKSYINNLRPEHSTLIPLIEQTLTAFLPGFEQVLHKKLKGRVQVIVKIASTELDGAKPNFPGGSWHLEGMPHEHIAATGIHYLTVEGITESFLEFRKPVIINEENVDYPQNDGSFTHHHYGIEKDSHYDGKMNRYLGLIRCTEGASVIFPNTLQHHVKDFSLAEGCERADRMILAFFLIDPDHRIISTEDVLPQQPDYPGVTSSVTFTPEEMLFHQERLMYHRKYYVSEINKEVYEREFSLCEH